MPEGGLHVESGFSRIHALLVIAGLLIAAALALFVGRGRPTLPQPGSAAYEEVTRAFYRGLASLEVGLLDDARREFASATERVPEEPAAWANLGLTRLRLGELDAASDPIGRALSLASDNADVVLMAGRMEIARGRLDEGLAHLRRAVELEPRALQARFALAEEVERAAGADADRQAAMLLDELAEIAPDNPAVHVERARLAAKRRDAQQLDQAIQSLQTISVAWPERALEQFRALLKAAAAGDLQGAQLATTFLRNVLASVPSFRESLSAVRTPTELIAEPINRFVRLTPPRATPSPADVALRFEGDETRKATSIDALVLEGGAPIDWNNDFRIDVVRATPEGVRLLTQDEKGGFADQPVGCHAVGGVDLSAKALATADACDEVWPADVEMDGDLDIVAARRNGTPVILRNNGTGDWTPVEMFAGVVGARSFAWADLDGDADPDAVFLDRESRVHVFNNRQAGDFAPVADFPRVEDVVALTVGDVDADGTFDVVTLTSRGELSRHSRPVSTWATAPLASWDGFASPAARARLVVADLDNNGAVDLVASSLPQSRIWLSDEQHRFVPLGEPLAADVFYASDPNGDGRLDLIGRNETGGPLHLMNRGTANYHWKVIQPRAQAVAGDQRINAFGVGGDIEIRSGLLVQRQVLTGGAVHFGLGDRTAIDVARIVWPNGVAQAEFGADVDDVFVAEQRLKGSCPWVFAWNGKEMRFVTDFLWRSPLGLRINAQDTAGVVQTEDWVRITGDQLAPRDGVYDIRITAELWETHYFDHVSLMVVDHPSATEIFVDERFSAAAPPALRVHVVSGRRPVGDARDHRGARVDAVVARRDGQHLATFAKGPYQGIGEEHFVEFSAPADGSDVLLASGWIYPTDSSINVAIGQGGHVTPMGLVLESQRDNGAWRVVDANLGFPAGKNKTIAIDLTKVRDATRLRLRTNLEIYWDALEFATRSDAAVQTTRLPAQRAELRYRGFSQTTTPRADTPETPHYDRIATTSQRWRDLIGYHTRFGDVKELLDTVDDRYVIMNAGDEMRIQFAEQPAPRDRWQRDFVLVGDGWEKDGDYNTGFSQTVLPLPSHAQPLYGAGVRSVELEDDPVYQRHKDDWHRYHTRFVTPRGFVDGLRNRSRK